MLSDGVQWAMIENDWREADRHLVTVLLDDPHDANCGCHRCTTVAALSDRLNTDAEDDALRAYQREADDRAESDDDRADD